MWRRKNLPRWKKGISIRNIGNREMMELLISQIKVYSLISFSQKTRKQSHLAISLTRKQENNLIWQKQSHFYNLICFYYFSELLSKKNGNVKFYVRLCFDVFFEELSFGNRRQLAKLESIGRSFRIVIDQKFGVTPFLRLNLTWYSNCFFSIQIFNLRKDNAFTNLLIVMGKRKSKNNWEIYHCRIR